MYQLFLYHPTLLTKKNGIKILERRVNLLYLKEICLILGKYSASAPRSLRLPTSSLDPVYSHMAQYSSQIGLGEPVTDTVSLLFAGCCLCHEFAINLNVYHFPEDDLLKAIIDYS